MKSALLGGLLLLFTALILAQDADRKHIPITMEDVLRQQTAGAAAKSSIALVRMWKMLLADSLKILAVEARVALVLALAGSVKVV